MPKSMDSGTRLLGFKFWLCPCELFYFCYYLMFLCLSFLFEKMGIVRIKRLIQLEQILIHSESPINLSSYYDLG